MKYILCLPILIDVAIGAPYENNNKGAVYIFNGYTDGLWPIYSQRILATDLHTGTSGFGIAISSGMNLNNDAINGIDAFLIL